MDIAVMFIWLLLFCMYQMAGKKKKKEKDPAKSTAFLLHEFTSLIHKNERKKERKKERRA